jgi:hypothetical protein
MISFAFALVQARIERHLGKGIAREFADVPAPVFQERIAAVGMVEPRGIEPLTSSLRTRRSPI